MTCDFSISIAVYNILGQFSVTVLSLSSVTSHWPCSRDADLLNGHFARNFRSESVRRTVGSIYSRFSVGKHTTVVFVRKQSLSIFTLYWAPSEIAGCCWPCPGDAGPRRQASVTDPTLSPSPSHRAAPGGWPEKALLRPLSVLSAGRHDRDIAVRHDTTLRHGASRSRASAVSLSVSLPNSTPWPKNWTPTCILHEVMSYHAWLGRSICMMRDRIQVSIM